jgi:hypothetical protein
MTVDHRPPAATRLSGLTAPIFILSTARSGSTLLRFILDTHADLACPPETNIPATCAQLASTWSTISGAQLSHSRKGVNITEIPDAVITKVRRVTDSMMGQYLTGHNKRRFCDKSIGTAAYAELLVRLYPEAKFICLVRHPMDFIRSALEACPWGPIGYGFDEYVASGSGNMVLALARYWIDYTDAIVSVAGRYLPHSYLMRYEDLVDAPEFVANRLFEFLGVPLQPGISHECFTVKRERYGQSDHKIWWTSEINSASVGRGESIPPGLVPAPVWEHVNAILDRLGYARVDKSWGTPDGPADPRVPGSAPPVERRTPPAAKRSAADGASLSLEKCLYLAAAKIDAPFRQRWQLSSGERFACVSRPQLAANETRWVIDLARGAVSDAKDEDYQWCVVGEPDAWGAVLRGEVDLGTSVRRGELRYCATGNSATSTMPSARSGNVAVDDRIAMVGDLLGLTPWQAAMG